MPLLPTNVVAGSSGHLANHNQIHGKLNDFPNIVRDYGADPTGVADSYSAVIAAITDTPADGGVVEVPTGIYDFGTTLDLTSRPTVNLRGPMASSNGDTKGAVFRTRVNGMTLMKVGNGTLIHQGPTIEGIHLKSKTGQTGFTLFEVDTVNRGRLDRVVFDATDLDNGTGLYLHHTNDLAWWLMMQPFFRGLHTSMQVDNSVGVDILGGGIVVPASDTAIGINSGGSSHMKLFGVFFDGGAWHIKGVFNTSDFVGCKWEKPRGVGAAVEFTGTSRRNRISGAIIGDGSTTGDGIIFGASASDNEYHISNENAAPGKTAVINNGSRNVGSVFDGGAARIGLQHYGATTPVGGLSGNIAVGNGKIWVNDAGTWKSVAIA